MYVAVRPVTGNIIQVFGWSVRGRWCGGGVGDTRDSIEREPEPGRGRENSIKAELLFDAALN